MPRKPPLPTFLRFGQTITEACGYHEVMIRAINAITIAGGIILLVMSLWPGYAGGCLLLLALPLIAMLGLVWLTNWADLKHTEFGTSQLFEAPYDPHQRHSQA